MEAKMEDLDACISAETDKIEPEISSLEDEVCEGGVLEPEEEEKLGESLKEVIKDKSVKPKVNYIMSSSSFSMLAVQSEDCGIIWETVSSSRCSTPWASESTASDVYSMESTPLSSPPGKVIFITDKLPQCSSVNEHQSNKKSKSEKHHVEAMDLRPGDALEMARNNLCVLRTQADKVQPVEMDKMTNSKLLKESNKTEVYSQPLIEHRPVLSKLARKPSEDGNVLHEVSAATEDAMQHHAPVHCRRKLHKNTVEQDENSVKLEDSCLINSFSTRPDQQVSMPPAKLRKQGESETLKHFSDTGLISALPECKDSRLSVETSAEPVSISHSKETCKDTELFSSPPKMVISNGTIPTGKGDLQNIKVASDYGPSFSYETSIPDCKKLASDEELTSVPFEDRSHLNRSPTGNTLTKTIPHHFPEKQEIMIKEDQAYSMANPEVKFLGMPITISSELTKPMGSAESGIPYKGTDNFGSVIKDECVEAADVNLQNLSFIHTVGMVAGMETPQSSERHEAEIQEKPFYSMANPETLEVLNGFLHSTTCRTPEDACHSRLVDLEDKLQLEEDSKIQKAVFNIVAEGSEILNIIAPASICSVDQEECRKMQDNLMYLQVNPIIEKKDFKGDIESTDSFNRMKDAQQSRLLGASQHCEQQPNPQNLWDSFTVGKSSPNSVVHTEHVHVTGSNPSNVAGSNPSVAIGTNPTHEIETNAQLDQLGSNPHTICSNPSHGRKSNPTSVETPNPSTVTVSNPASTEQCTAVDKSAKKSGTKEDDYFEKYTLVDEQVPIDPVTIVHKVRELSFPEVEDPSVINLEMGLSTEEKELFNFDEFDVSRNPGSYDDTTEFSVQTPKPEPLRRREEADIAGVFYHKEAGSLLFDTTEGILSRSHNFPISTKLVDLTLLEEPPALAFYYKDLYEEAKGRREQNNDQSDEDSSNPELSFQCQSSDTDEGTGLYFEKYILKDDILDLPRGTKPEQSPYLNEALPQNVAVEAERISLFSENEEQFPAIDIDKAEVAMQERDSEKILELQKEYEEKSMEEHEGQKVLSETLSITCEEVSEDLSMAVEQKEENTNEMTIEGTLDIQISPFEETFYVKEKLSSDVKDHLDTGHLVNLDYSFDEYGNLSSETGLDINYNFPAREIKVNQGCVSSKKADIYQNEFDILKKEQSIEQKFRIEDEQAPAELGQETDQECIQPSRNIENTAHDEIIIGEHTLETEEIAPQPGTEEYGNTDYTARMDEEICKCVLKEDFGLNDKTLHLESTEIPIAVDEMETSEVEIIDLQSIESISKEKVNIETEDLGKTMDETGFEENYDLTLSEVNNYEIIPDLTEELQEEECLTGDTVQPMQSKYKSPKMPSSEILTDVITYERESKHIFDDIQTRQDSHRTISEAEDNETEVPQEHCPEIIQNKVDINNKAYLHESSEDLLVKDVEEESKDLSLMEDVKIIEDESNQAELDSLEFTDKELEEITQEETQELSLQKTIGEEIVGVIPQKPPKPADTYCVTCGLPIFAIDKLFGEHQDHDVISIDAAVVNLKEKLDEFVEAAEEKACRTEGFVTELEDAFNTVEENCAKEEKNLEEQHEEVMNLLLSQYTEMTQVLEEEKKMKLEHLCDQMVHYRCSIDSTKEAAAKTKESFEFDDMAFLKSFRMINDRVISALETAVSLDLKPSWCSSLEDLAVKSSRSGFESLKNLPVPHSPTVVPQEPNTATSTTITVYWTVAEEDVIDYFQVYCVEHSEGSRELSGSTTEEYKMAVKESYCVLDNLEPSRCYLVWVMAVNFAGCSLPSEKVMIQTVPAAPMINAEDCTVCWDSATIRWTSGDLNTIDFFILEFHKQNYHQKSKFRSMAGIRGCEQTVSLPPLENFLFFVKAVNSLGCSDTSKPALISTKSTRFHLNKETIPPSMQLSEDGTVIHFDDQAMENENPLTEYCSVLGEALPPRGQHYWEVTVDRCEAYRIGVTYPSTRNCSLGRSNKSWCMRYYATAAGYRYEFLHNSTSHDVLLTEFPTSVGVFVDCDSGQLLFFNAHNGQLLHTFRHQFTDFIYPAFVVEKPGFLSVCTGIELPKFAKCSKC